jgi:hypothetical protein
MCLLTEEVAVRRFAVALQLGGLVVIAVGAGLVAVPAGLVVAGVGMLLVGMVEEARS